MDVKTVIQSGIKVLEDNEWGQGSFFKRKDGVDHYCASGALEKGVFPSAFTTDWGGDRFSDNRERFDRLREARALVVKKAKTKGATGLVNYNDFHATSKADVINLFNEVLEEI